MTLKDKLAGLPAKPGVYRFLNKEGSLLYIGKAKNLKNRVKSYFNKSAGLTPVKSQMVARIKKMEYTVVSNETEALLLEASLIKKYQPPYNIILKDDKSWLYIMITKDDFPQVVAIRQTDRKFTEGRKYFGPYTSSSSVRQTLKLLRKIFPYFTAKGPMVELGTKTGSPYHLGRYLAGRKISKTKWLEEIKLIASFLAGQSGLVTKELKEKMKQASAKKDFEKAAVIRNQLTAVEKIIVSQKVISTENDNDDYLGTCLKNSQAVITLLKVRQGKLLDQLNFHLKNLQNLNPEEILEQFLEKYYKQTEDRPERIYLPLKLESEFKTFMPQQGNRQKLIKLAEENAQAYLANSLASFEKERSKADRGLAELIKVLK